MQTLTISEAIAQGYEYYLINPDGYQSLKDLADLDPTGIDWPTGIVLANKEPYHPAGLSAADIADILADNIESAHGDESGDDTNIVYDTIKALDFTEASNKIAEALSQLRYYKATDIQLLPDLKSNL